MSADRVDAVIAAIERTDPVLARLMDVAADGLTAGEGEELITQAGLQRYLWYDLPRRSPDDTWRPVAEAAGVLLALLGLDRYAAIARSAATSAVLDAWSEAPGKGFTAFRLFGLLDETRPRWEGGRLAEPAVTALTSAGRAAAFTFQRARAAAPGRRTTSGLG